MNLCNSIIRRRAPGFGVFFKGLLPFLRTKECRLLFIQRENYVLAAKVITYSDLAYIWLHAPWARGVP